jgi:hypothetical protein
MTSVFMRVEGLDCFNQNASSIVTSAFFNTNRSLGAQIILDERLGLLSLTEVQLPVSSSTGIHQNLS